MKCALSLATTPSAICVGTSGASQSRGECAQFVPRLRRGTTPPPATISGRARRATAPPASPTAAAAGRGPATLR